MLLSFFFFFNDTATTEIYTLSLHDALPISPERTLGLGLLAIGCATLLVLAHKPLPWFPGQSFTLPFLYVTGIWTDRKSTRLNSSHANISYAVFCLKKKKKRIS